MTTFFSEVPKMPASSAALWWLHILIAKGKVKDVCGICLSLGATQKFEQGAHDDLDSVGTRGKRPVANRRGMAHTDSKSNLFMRLSAIWPESKDSTKQIELRGKLRCCARKSCPFHPGNHFMSPPCLHCSYFPFAKQTCKKSRREK